MVRALVAEGRCLCERPLPSAPLDALHAGGHRVALGVDVLHAGSDGLVVQSALRGQREGGENGEHTDARADPEGGREGAVGRQTLRRRVGGDHRSDDGYWQRELPDAAVTALLEELEAGEARSGDHPPHVYDELILDEAQDVLRQNYLDFLDLSVRDGLQGGRWRIFGDFQYQRVYDASTLTLDDFVSAGGYPVWSLATNCRNTPRVAAMACACAALTGAA